MPAIYDLANRGLLPPGFALVGFARRDWADQDFAQVVHDAVKEHARTPFREEVWKQLAEGFRFVPGRLRRRRRRSTGCARPIARARPSPRHRRQPRVLPVDPAEVLPRSSSSSCKEHGLADAATAQLAPGRHREAVRPRPGQRARAEPRRRRGLPARVGVPHRPLPRQGDGPEHPGAAVRQPAVRADLERQLRRPRADHDGRGHRHRRPGRLLRRHRRGPRRHPEPPAAAARADRDGGAGLLRRPRRCGTEKEKVLSAVTAARRPRPAHRPRPVRRRLAGRRAR